VSRHGCDDGRPARRLREDVSPDRRAQRRVDVGLKPLRVAIVGCGLIGSKRAAALGSGDALVACYDIDARAADRLARRYNCCACSSPEKLFALAPDVVVVATVHDRLAELAERALAAGAHVLVEKPAAVSAAQVDRLIECQRAGGRLVKVGFNHRFHPAPARAAAEVHAGVHGELMQVRARYGHGGRPGYEREWRADRPRSGGGELVDQGMHLLDLCHWLAGPLPLHSALLRTQFWDADVEDNAALILGEPGVLTGPWAMLHVSWTEWKNLFSLEVYCRTAKLQVDGLGGSYGPERLRIYRMGAELGPPVLEEVLHAEEDVSWRLEWEHFTAAIRAGDGRALSGDLWDARYAWSLVEAAYDAPPPGASRDLPAFEIAG
jgi:predicted dehydrogenase